MGKFQVQETHKNMGLFGVVVLIYIALLLLFAWQTLLFVNILFPDADLTMKILTVFSVDGMGFVWACLHTFYRFAHPNAKMAVRWGWAITYGLSALLSILYLVFTFILNFQHVTDDIYIKIGVGLSIGALMFNLGMISIFLFWEISTRFPNEDEFEIVEVAPRPRKGGQPKEAPVESTTRALAQSPSSLSQADIEQIVQRSVTQALVAVQPTTQSPLPLTPLDTTTASQPGMMNGQQNGH